MKYNQKEYKNNFKSFSELYKNINNYLETAENSIIKKYSDGFCDESKYYLIKTNPIKSHLTYLYNLSNLNNPRLCKSLSKHYNLNPSFSL